MIQEYFWKNDKKSFFQHGNYMPRKQRFPKDTIGLYMIDSTGNETNITSFDMIRHNSDTDVAGEACLSLLEWAKYLLEPNAELDNDNDLKRNMMSYQITDDEINWKKETDTNTTDTDALASVTDEDNLWNKIDLGVENKTAAELRHHIAQALDLTHSRYRNLKRVNKTQQDEKDIIEQVMLSIMQMHSNATGAAETKSWKNTYCDISALYHEELNSNKLTDSVINEAPEMPPEKPIHATSDSDNDDDDDDSDYVDTSNHKKKSLLFPDEEDSDDHRKKYALFDDEDESDEEESDDPGTQNTLGKESGHKKNAVAIDNETTESGNAATNDVSDKSAQESVTTNKSDAAGNNKRAADENLQVNKEKTTQIWDNDEEDSKDVSNMEHEEEYEKEPSGTATGNDKTDHESAKGKKKRKRKW